MPGPASTVEERSLRKIFHSQGTVDRYPPQDNFSVAINSQKGLTEIQYVDGRHSRNLQIGKSCCDKNLLLYERERSLNKSVL